MLIERPLVAVTTTRDETASTTKYLVTRVVGGVASRNGVAEDEGNGRSIQASSASFFFYHDSRPP
jgi:hypothetical protein